MKSSWKTTVCGLLALIGGGLTQFYPEYAQLGGFLAFLGSGLGLLFARDNNVTSEQAGANDPGKPPTLANRLPVLALCGFLALGGSGCNLFKGATPAKAAVNVSDVSKVTVEAALRAWDDYIVRYHPPLSQQRQVKEAWENYRAAQVLILDAALILKEAETAGTTTPEQQAQLNYAVTEASAALADLIKLLQGFGVKL